MTQMQRTRTAKTFAAMAVTLLGCALFAFFSQESTGKADNPQGRILSASPSLYPVFNWNQRDYVIRCQVARGTPRVNLNLPRNWKAGTMKQNHETTDRARAGACMASSSASSPAAPVGKETEDGNGTHGRDENRQGIPR